MTQPWCGFWQMLADDFGVDWRVGLVEGRSRLNRARFDWRPHASVMAVTWKSRIWLLSLLASWLGGGSIEAQQGEIRLDDLTRRFGVEQRAVRISSGHPGDRKLMARAFSAPRCLSGAREWRCRLSFPFHLAGRQCRSARDRERAILPRCSSLRPSRGADWRNAALLAGDTAVRKTVGTPGFFGGKIAFIGGSHGIGEVYVTDLFFGSVRRLTSDRAASLLPRFSPDGRYILYTGYFSSGFPDVFRIDRLTGERTVFASFRGSNSGATYSPNGTEVTLVLSRFWKCRALPGRFERPEHRATYPDERRC